MSKWLFWDKTPISILVRLTDSAFQCASQGPPAPRNRWSTYFKADCKIERPNHYDLTAWATQGVLLLNAALSVQDGVPNSHKIMWKHFTDAVIKAVNEKTEPVVFVLWGRDAQKKRKLITNDYIHHVIEAPHPAARMPWVAEAQVKEERTKPNVVSGSPYNRFGGSRPFSEVNEFLAAHYREEVKPGIGVIDWRIK